MEWWPPWGAEASFKFDGLFIDHGGRPHFVGLGQILIDKDIHPGQSGRHPFREAAHPVPEKGVSLLIGSRRQCGLLPFVVCEDELSVNSDYGNCDSFDSSYPINQASLLDKFLSLQPQFVHQSWVQGCQGSLLIASPG